MTKEVLLKFVNSLPPDQGLTMHVTWGKCITLLFRKTKIYNNNDNVMSTKNVIS